MISLMTGSAIIGCTLFLYPNLYECVESLLPSSVFYDTGCVEISLNAKKKKELASYVWSFIL